MRHATLMDNQTGLVHVLHGKTTRIGREEDNDIILHSRLVSRRHLELQRRPTGYFLIDVGSSHGYYLNGRRGKKTSRLKDGDRILIAVVYANGNKSSSFRASSTATSLHIVLAKEKIDTGDENLQVGADFTFHIEERGVLECLADIFARSSF